MTEELEFLISQYADGTLPKAERPALEKILERDESARALLAEYRRLDEAIRDGSIPLPHVRWDELHKHLSDLIAAESEQADRMKILPARSIGPIGWMAVAASLAVAFGLAVELLHPKSAPNVAAVPQVVPLAVVTGPAVEAPAGIASADVIITAPMSAQAAALYPDAEGVVYQPSHVTIASAVGIGEGLAMMRVKLGLAAIALLLVPALSTAQNTSALIGQALDRQLPKAQIDFNGTLPQIIQTFNDLTSVPIEADSAVYDALPWGELTTFSAKFEHETLRQALAAMCPKLGLEFELGKEAVELRPMPALRRMGRRATVDELKALDLLSSTTLDATGLHPTAQALIDLIDAKLEKSSYAIENRAFDSETEKTVVTVARNATLLDALEEIGQQTNATWYPWGNSLVIVKKQDQIRMQLSKRMTTRFNGVEVNQVLLELAERSGVDFEIEPGAIARIGADFRTINLTLDNATVQQTLEHVAAFTGLGYAITDKGVWIWNASPATTEP